MRFWTRNVKVSATAVLRTIRGQCLQSGLVAAILLFAALPASAQTRTMWINAGDLQPEFPITADLVNQGDFYYGNKGSLFGYFTSQLTLPEGSVISNVTCFFRDQDPNFNGAAHLLRVYEYDNVGAASPNYQPLLSMGTSGGTGGSSGFQRPSANVPIPIQFYGQDTLGNTFSQFYVLYVALPPLNLLTFPPVLTSVTFRGCRIQYQQ